MDYIQWCINQLYNPKKSVVVENCNRAEKNYIRLKKAAVAVIDNWDHGDLAAAVRELDQALKQTKGE